MRRSVMKLFLATTLMVFLSPMALAQDDAVSTVMSTILRERESLHPGDSQSQLEKLFVPDGGLSSELERTYVSRHCSYVKVDVQLRIPESREDTQVSPVILSLSSLYVA